MMLQLQWTQKRGRRTDEELAEIQAKNTAEKQIWEATQKRKQEPPPPKKQKLLPTEMQQVKGLSRFVAATEKAFAALETNAAHKTSAMAFDCCNQVTSKVLSLIQSGKKIDEAPAILYRDTTVRLGILLSEPAAMKKLELQLLTKTMIKLEMVIKLSCKKLGVAAALLDPRLQSTWLDFKNYISGHDNKGLLKMKRYISSFLEQGKQGSLRTLLDDFKAELIFYRNGEASGSPTRSEKSWNLFAEIGEVMADWIGSTTSLNKKEKKSVRSMFRELKTFDEKFPDRVRPYLFQIARLQDGLCRSQRMYEVEMKALGSYSL